MIGSGATAVTLVPTMAKDTASMVMLQRSPTYIADIPLEDPTALNTANLAIFIPSSRVTLSYKIKTST